MTREGFGIRFAAGMIDSILLQLLAAPMLVIVMKNLLQMIFFALLIPCTDGHSQSDADQAMGRVQIAAGLLSVVVVLYSAMEIFLAASPGKLLLKLRIRDLSGAPARFDQRLGRWAMKNAWLAPYLAAVCLIVSGSRSQEGLQVLLWSGRILAVLVFLGFLTCASSDQMAVYDRLAKTAVFRLTDKAIVGAVREKENSGELSD